MTEMSKWDFTPLSKHLMVKKKISRLSRAAPLIRLEMSKLYFDSHY